MNQNVEKGSARPSRKTYTLVGLAGIAALLLWMLSSAGAVKEGNASTFEVIRGDFLVSVTAGGNFEGGEIGGSLPEGGGAFKKNYISPLREGG